MIRKKCRLQILGHFNFSLASDAVFCPSQKLLPIKSTRNHISPPKMNKLFSTLTKSSPSVQEGTEQPRPRIRVCSELGEIAPFPPLPPPMALGGQDAPLSSSSAQDRFPFRFLPPLPISLFPKDTGRRIKACAAAAAAAAARVRRTKFNVEGGRGHFTSPTEERRGGELCWTFISPVTQEMKNPGGVWSRRRRKRMTKSFFFHQVALVLSFQFERT